MFHNSVVSVGKNYLVTFNLICFIGAPILMYTNLDVGNNETSGTKKTFSSDVAYRLTRIHFTAKSNLRNCDKSYKAISGK